MKRIVAVLGAFLIAGTLYYLSADKEGDESSSFDAKLASIN